MKKREENIEDPAFRRLSQDVLIFLIENQDNFVIGTVGTEIEVTKFEPHTGQVEVRRISAEQKVQEAICRTSEDTRRNFSF